MRCHTIDDCTINASDAAASTTLCHLCGIGAGAVVDYLLDRTVINDITKQFCGRLDESEIERRQ